MIAALLLAAALATGADSATTIGPPPARNTRFIATAGPTFVEQDGTGRTAIGLGTGVQWRSRSVLALAFRLDVHALREPGARQTTTGMFVLKFQLRAEDSRVWPYAFWGGGYGTAPSYSDFILPASSALGGGVQIVLPGGQELFLEAAWTSANESTLVPLRLGVLLP